MLVGGTARRLAIGAKAEGREHPPATAGDAGLQDPWLQEAAQDVSDALLLVDPAHRPIALRLRLAQRKSGDGPGTRPLEVAAFSFMH